MATNRKSSAISGATFNRLAIGVIATSAMTVQSAFATPAGGGAPAPEIGVGVLGAILSVAAVKFFRRHQ
jgi:hypothetical protein